MHSFKRMIAVTLTCVLCVGIIFTGIAEFYFSNSYYYYQDSETRENFAGQIDFLICGSSHGLRAFSPEILDEELGCFSYNISGALMTMQGRYTLFEKEIERNPVETVVIEVSFNALSRNRTKEGAEGDLYVLARLDNAAERLKYFFSSMRLSEYDRVLYDTMDRGIQCIDWKFDGRSQVDTTVSKGYRPQGTVDCTTSADSYEKNFHRTKFSETVDQYNIKYLNKIIDICKEKNVRMIFVVTPISGRYESQHSNTDIVMAKFREIAENAGAEFYDFNLLKGKDDLFPADTAYYDDSHLSESGAETFNRELARVISSAMQGEDTDSLFHSSYIEAQQYYNCIK